ncbi:MAG TPA: radical SAM family heme chaperone HemW [Bacilli bacterium]|nr:radical SAM family heme chaperone HemW [Bacilli bacterium]
MKSAYIHIPFCKSICSYCDFCKMNYQKEWIEVYLDVLKEEIEEKYADEYLDTIYIGGGTPSCLSKEELNKLFDIIKIFNLNEEYEFTFECNVNDITEELLNILKENQVNRLSIGVESFNNNNLKLIERKHTFEDALTKINLVKNYGFNNINVDLIYALPEETLSTVKKDINQLLKLDIPHISTYSLIIEEHTKLKIKGIKEIDQDLDAKMYEYIVKKLTNNNYNHYEISNFAKKGYESRHNLTYWNNEYYYGFGLGAHGYVHGVRYENTRSFHDYLNGNYILEENILSKQQIMENELMLGLRKTKGINLNEFFNKYDINLQDVFDIKPLLKTKDLIYKNGNIFVNPSKLYVMNEILLKLI